MKVLTVYSARKVKIFYKNGTTYTVKNPITFNVLKRKSGGHDVDYSILSNKLKFKNKDDIYISYPVKTVQTSTQDVVAVEVTDGMVNGTELDFVRQAFKKGS